MSEPSGTDARLDRIEALTAKVKLMDDLDAINGEKIEALTAELNTCRMAQVVMDNTVAELEAKLAKAVEALDEAIYLLAPDEKDMMRQAGVYRIVTTLAEIKGESHE
jgi:hypothetical protein